MLLLIPVENQVRELDPKLLLACLAARRGFSSVIGSRRELEFGIDSYPPSLYLSKSMTKRSLLFFRIARKFGHSIVAWDEEALVHLPPETYFARRLHPEAIRLVSHLFAWGRDNVELWRQYPDLPEGIPIHCTGNPRSDMLRPELHEFYQEEVEALEQQYGDFVLVNTNFNHVNAFGPDLNLFQPVERPGEPARFGRAAQGMTRDYAQGLWDHKHAVLESFRQMIPRLASAFRDLQIVIRPHPTERHEIYNEIAAHGSRIHVTNRGNVVPWLRACRAVLHNGCTTGVEAFVMGVPAISYRAAVSEAYDDGFYRLPNALSHQCFDFEQLEALLRQILAKEVGAASGPDREAVIAQYLESQTGPLACERMADVLADFAEQHGESPPPSAWDRIQRGAIGRGYHLYKRLKPRFSGSHNKPEFQRHRYPPVSLEALRDKVARLQRILRDTTRLEIEPLGDVLFRISVPR